MLAALHRQHVVQIRWLDPAASLEIRQAVADELTERGVLHAPHAKRQAEAMLGLANDSQLVGGFPARKGHVINVAIARNLNLKPLGQGIDTLGADAVQTFEAKANALLSQAQAHRELSASLALDDA